MKSSLPVLLVCAFMAVSAAAQDAASPAAPTAVKGKMLVAANGARLGSIYRVGPDGSAQLIIDGKMVTVPASTFCTLDDTVTVRLPL